MRCVFSDQAFLFPEFQVDFERAEIHLVRFILNALSSSDQLSSFRSTIKSHKFSVKHHWYIFLTIAIYLNRAVQEDDPFTRMKEVVRWYLSGFYKKPKGLKKPYNPILGETFRCYWRHPNGSRTFYVAEQVGAFSLYFSVFQIFSYSCTVHILGFCIKFTFISMFIFL